MNEIQRLQQLAGILTEIKVNNPVLQKQIRDEFDQLYQTKSNESGPYDDDEILGFVEHQLIKRYPKYEDYIKSFYPYEEIDEIKINKPNLANAILDILVELGDKVGDLDHYLIKYNIEGEGDEDNLYDMINNSPRQNQQELYNALKNI